MDGFKSRRGLAADEHDGAGLTAPRAVASAAVQTPGGEGEQFLFYRGVAHIDAPLRVSRNAGDELVFQSQVEALPGSQSLPVSSLCWWISGPKEKSRFVNYPRYRSGIPSKSYCTRRQSFRPGISVPAISIG